MHARMCCYCLIGKRVGAAIRISMYVVISCCFIASAFRLVRSRAHNCTGSVPWIAQLDEDFAPYVSMSDEQRLNVPKRMWEYASTNSKDWPIVSVISIRGNELYVKTFGNKTNPKLAGLLAPLKNTLNCFKVPDVDLYMDSSDACDVDIPILAWNKRRGEKCVLYPWSQFMAPSIYSQQSKPDWRTRMNKAVFRGSTTNADPAFACDVDTWHRLPRIKTVLYCRNHSDKCDAGLTSVVHCSDSAKTEILGSINLSKALTWRQEMQYRHILLLDGNGAPASRSLKALTGGFTVLKQQSGHIEFYYSALKPWKHYVPLAKDLSDLEEKLKYVQSRPMEAETIANSTAAFAARYINDFTTTCYLSALLNRYSSLFPTSTLIPRDMISNFTPYRDIVPKEVAEYVNSRLSKRFKKMCGKFTTI